MRYFKITLQHDNGKFLLITTASDQDAAINAICAAEHCPPSAIVKIQDITNKYFK